MTTSDSKTANQLISPANPIALNLVGSYLLIVFLLCIKVNVILIYVFVRFERIRTGLNKLILVTSLFNLFGSISLPILVQSHFDHK
jgi:hypothetical protein